MKLIGKIRRIWQTLLSFSIIIVLITSCNSSIGELESSPNKLQPKPTLTLNPDNTSPAYPPLTQVPNSASIIESQPEQAALSEIIANDFMANLVGTNYFSRYFTLQQADLSGDLLKVSYTYEYPPYIDDYSMTLFLDTSAMSIIDNEISTILRTPQVFKIDQTEALIRAEEQGLDSTGPNQTEIRIGVETNHRFAWSITGPVDNTIEAQPGTLMIVVLDVETGQIYIRDLIGIDTEQ